MMLSVAAFSSASCISAYTTLATSFANDSALDYPISGAVQVLITILFSTDNNFYNLLKVCLIEIRIVT
jgi:hypothetical protein